MPTPAKYARYTEQIAVLVGPQTLKAVDRIAKKEVRSRSDVVRELIEEGVERRSQS